ncbi:MAG: hypothetical protein WBG54_02375 [Acidobacteriaceae bacterium]
MNVAAHEVDAGEYKADQADHRARVFGERLDGLHQGLSTAETDGSLGVGDGTAGAHEQERGQRRGHHVRGLEKVLFGENLRQSFREAGCITGKYSTAGDHRHLRRLVYCRPEPKASAARSASPRLRVHNAMHEEHGKL